LILFNLFPAEELETPMMENGGHLIEAENNLSEDKEELKLDQVQNFMKSHL
jgi:hypothetical protein